MAEPTSSSESGESPRTSESLLLRAGQDGPTGAEARGRLAERYREPLLAMYRVLKDPRAEERVADFLQDFFLIPRPAHQPPYRFQQWSRQGRFGNYVYRAGSNHRIGELRRQAREVPGLTPEFPDLAADCKQTPEDAFFRGEALKQLAEVVDALRQTFPEADRGDFFDFFLAQIGNDSERVTYEAFAEKLQKEGRTNARGEPLTASTLRVRCHRLAVELEKRLADMLAQEGHGGSAEALAEFWNLLGR